MAITGDFPSLNQIVAGDRVRSFEILTRLAASGHPVEVISLGDREPTRVLGVVVSPLTAPSEPWTDIQTVARLARELRRLASAQPTGSRPWLYLKAPFGMMLRGGCLPVHRNPAHLLVPFAKKLGYRIWLTYHDVSPHHERAVLARLERAGQSTESRQVRLYIRAARWTAREAAAVARRADLITVVSRGMAAKVAASTGASPSRIHVIPTGVNPSVVEGVPPWRPPSDGAAWTIGYLGMDGDVEMRSLFDGLAQFSTRSDRSVNLLLGRPVPDEVRVPSGVTVVVEETRYAEFKRFASCVDVWVNTFDRSDSYIDRMGSPIKVPMCLASGRPLIMTPTESMGVEGLQQYAITPSAGAAGLAASLQSILEQPGEASVRAANTAREVLRRRSWDSSVASLVSTLAVATNQ